MGSILGIVVLLVAAMSAVAVQPVVARWPGTPDEGDWYHGDWSCGKVCDEACNHDTTGECFGLCVIRCYILKALGYGWDFIGDLLTDYW